MRTPPISNSKINSFLIDWEAFVRFGHRDYEPSLWRWLCGDKAITESNFIKWVGQERHDWYFALPE